jgi:HEAT repeat protein
MAEPPAPSAPQAALEASFVALQSYDRGSSRAALLPLDAAVAASTVDVSERGAMETQLIAALQEGGSIVRREYICSKLKLVGSDASVKAVAALLLVPELVTAARDVLQAIPGDEATQALRAALTRADGPTKVAVIQSLGLRYDEASVTTLRELLEDLASPVASAAAAALGEIGTIEAANALRAFHRRAPEALRPAAVDACLVCAEKLAAAGRKSDAAALYQLLATDAHPKHVQYAAKQGLAKT